MKINYKLLNSYSDRLIGIEGYGIYSCGVLIVNDNGKIVYRDFNIDIMIDRYGCDNIYYWFHYGVVQYIRYIEGFGCYINSNNNKVC